MNDVRELSFEWCDEIGGRKANSSSTWMRTQGSQKGYALDMSEETEVSKVGKSLFDIPCKLSGMRARECSRGLGQEVAKKG
jgi:hypothetical protein